MAKRFTFRLEAVLRLRRMAEDDCRRQVASKLREIARVTSDMRRLDEQHRWEISRTRENQQLTSMDVLAVRRCRSYMGYLHRRQRECEGQVRGLRRELEEDQRALAHASKEVKVLEQLRDRQWARHRDAERRAERNQEDEVAQLAFLRAGAAGAE
jgi:flagellar FliJ protein